MVTRERQAAGRYARGFLARYLRPFVFDVMVRHEWSQAEVADSLGMPGHALSDYLSRRAHPSPEREQQLLRLGCDARRLRRVLLADKLAGLLETMDLCPDEARGALRRIEADHSRHTANSVS